LLLLKAASPSRSSSCRPYSRATVSPRSSISACRAALRLPSKIVGTNVSQRERSFRSITVGGRDAARVLETATGRPTGQHTGGAAAQSAARTVSTTAITASPHPHDAGRRRRCSRIK